MSQTKRRILFRPASVLLLGALAMLLAQSVAHAEQITISGGDFQAIGDPGGTSFSNTTGSAGQGLPTVLGGWPNSPTPPGFAPDPSFNNAVGISGFDNLTAAGVTPLTVSQDQAGPVTFTFFGKGDSTFSNQFLVNGTKLFDSTSSQGASQTLFLPAGKLNFSWIAGTTPSPTTVSNGTLSDPNAPGFFAGVDPYQASGTFQTMSLVGGSVFVGLTDRLVLPPGESDHDFQDLSVRISVVPEPASLLMGSTAALIGLGYSWSRRKRASA